MRAAVLVEGDDRNPNNFVAPVRLVEPLEAIAEVRPFSFRVANSVAEMPSRDLDLVILQRACFNSADEVDAAMMLLRKHRRNGAAVVLEVDDDLFCPELPALIAESAVDVLDEAQYHRTQAHRRLLDVVDGVICSTAALATAFRALTRAPVHVVPIALDFRRPRWRVRARRSSRRVTLGWCGGSRVGRDLELLVPALRTIMSIEERVDFLYAGPAKYRRLFADLPAGRVRVHEWVPYDRYPALMATVDLALAPLADHRYNRCKSELKLVDFGAVGVPAACSGVPTYEAFRGAVWGTANDVSDWVELVRRFVAAPPGPPSRAALRRSVRRLYDVRAGIAHHWNVLQALAGTVRC
ncbi:MAG: hypothetical protein M3N49_02200 [Candidatus Eremiobacteraeota bacterium]|nr:hypothetical protein [Candidatus Eremiobacteraeota bacterium]